MPMSRFMMPGFLRSRGHQSRRRVCTTSVHRVSLEFSLNGAMMCGQPDMPGLVVIKLGNSENLQQWNVQNPNERIEVGDVILEVNGVCEPRMMLEEFRKARSVDMLINTERSTEQQKLFKLALTRCHMEETINGILKPMSPDDIVPDEVCSICHDDLCHKSNVTKLPCGHHFHRACVKKWLVSGQPRCPLCNHDFAQGAWLGMPEGRTLA